MNKKHYVDAISDEMLAKMVDKTLNFEKTAKNKNLKSTLLKMIPAAASIVFVIGIINVLPVITNLNHNNNETDLNSHITATEFSAGSIITTTVAPDSTDLSDDITIVKIIERATVNINPKYINKWQGSSSNYVNAYVQDIDTVIENYIKINTQVPTADGIEIYLPNGVIIKTHDTVKIDDRGIIIAGDTIIDGTGAVTEEGKGKFTIIDKEGIKADINGGNQKTYTGNDPDGYALENYSKSGFKGIIDFLPYISKNAIDEIARTEYEKVGKLNKLDEIIVIIMSKNLLNEFAEKEYGSDSLKNIPDFALPYINSSLIDELAKTEFEKSGLENFSMHVWSYISEDLLQEFVKKEYETNGFKNFTAQLYPYIDKNIINEIAETEYEKSSFEKFPIYIYSYMSTSAIDEIAKKEFEKNGVKNFPVTFTSLMSTNAVDELAVKEYEKNGSDSLSNPVLTYMSESELEKIVLNEYEKTGELPKFNGGKTGIIVRPWVSYTFGSDKIFQFKSGAKITMPTGRVDSDVSGNGEGSIILSQICTIELTNGVTINAPKNTEVAEDEKGKFTIKIGDGKATIIQADGTSSTVSAGTSLDSNGK